MYKAYFIIFNIIFTSSVFAKEVLPDPTRPNNFVASVNNINNYSEPKLRSVSAKKSNVHKAKKEELLPKTVKGNSNVK